MELHIRLSEHVKVGVTCNCRFQDDVRVQKNKLIRLWGDLYERTISRRVTISHSEASLIIDLVCLISYDVCSESQLLHGSR